MVGVPEAVRAAGELPPQTIGQRWPLPNGRLPLTGRFPPRTIPSLRTATMRAVDCEESLGLDPATSQSEVPTTSSLNPRGGRGSLFARERLKQTSAPDDERLDRKAHRTHDRARRTDTFPFRVVETIDAHISRAGEECVDVITGVNAEESGAINLDEEAPLYVYPSVT